MGSNPVYVSGGPSADIYPGAGYTGFEEFVTPAEAAARAVEINPAYDTSLILGSLTLDPVNVSDPLETAYIGANLTLDCEYECTDPSATVTYSWSGPTGDLGVGGSSLILDNVSEAYSGIYMCTVIATNSLNQSGASGNQFLITITPAPAPQPSGVLNTGRSGAGPQDLAPSYFPSLSNMPAGVTEADLELYIPGTNTVIPYNNSLPAPFKFDSMGNCYNPGDYRTVIRVAETGAVLATVYPVAGPNKDIFWLYNPVVPAAPAGSSVAIGE
jgi:hypothetical protein